MYEIRFKMQNVKIYNGDYIRTNEKTCIDKIVITPKIYKRYFTSKDLSILPF